MSYLSSVGLTFNTIQLKVRLKLKTFSVAGASRRISVSPPDPSGDTLSVGCKSSLQLLKVEAEFVWSLKIFRYSIFAVVILIAVICVGFAIGICYAIARYFGALCCYAERPTIPGI